MNNRRKLFSVGLMLVVLFLNFWEFDLKRAQARPEALMEMGTSTPTPTYTPTVTSTPDKMYFSLSNSNTVPPEDALAEMTFFQGGGYIHMYCDSELGALQYGRQLMVPVMLDVCWPEPNEQVLVIVYRPDKMVNTGCRY